MNDAESSARSGQHNTRSVLMPTESRKRTRCIEAGMPPKVLQHQLGHTDISTTLNTYCDVFDNYSDKYLDKTQEYFEQQNIAI